MKLKKVEGREGQWEAIFPRNDSLACSHEVHVLLANLSNVDWRPVLNLWAVMEYITKYATKAQKGSRSMGEVLRGAMEEVCKYMPEDGTTDLLRRSFQKCFARTIGERDYGIFEAAHLGLRLPLVFPLLPMVSLNTLGARAFKTHQQLQRERERGVQDPATTWDSKIDNFDKRRQLLHAQTENDPGTVITRAEVESVSFFEFFWKYYVSRGKLHAATSPVCLNVTPAMSADCANISDARHEMYARTAVVAYWRLMPTAERHELARQARGLRLEALDERLLGGTVFERPMEHAGFPESNRFLGIRDLVMKFDGFKTRRGRKEVG